MFCRPFHCGLGLWLILAASTAPCFAAEVEAPGQNPPPLYRVRRWMTEQGLPQNRISSLQRTRDGYLWIGTWAGVARFDGVRFTVFDKYNTPALKNDTINALAEDTEGTLWIGTADGLVSYHEHRFHRLTKDDGLPESKIWRLSSSPSGGVWLQAGSQVARLQKGQFSRACNLHLPFWAIIQSMRERVDGSLSIITSAAWLTLSPTAELRTNFSAEASGFIRLYGGISDTRSGNSWIGTEHGLRCGGPESWRPAGPDELLKEPTEFIQQDSFGNLWVKSKTGAFYLWDHARWLRIDLEDPVAPASVICMEGDREGNSWVGTSQGLVQLGRRRVRTYTTRDGLLGNDILSVCESADGTVWVASNGGLSRIRNDRVFPMEVPEPLREIASRCVWPLADGGVWLAKAGIGIFEFREGFTVQIEAQHLPDSTINAIYADQAGRRWIATPRGVAVFKDGKVTDRYTKATGQPIHDARCILEDRDRNMWFGTQGQGLIRLRGGKLDVFTTRDGLSSDRVWALHEDAQGMLWIGTEDGLTRWNAGRFSTINTKHGLMENAVLCILEDDLGCLWMSGLRGIYRLKPEQLNAVADHRAEAINVASFGTIDGMESSEANGEHQPAGWKARDGRLWFPTTCGLVEIDPKTIPTNEVPPPAAIEQVLADDQIIFGDGARAAGPTIKLGPGRARVLQVRYTANSMSAPERVRFKYNLEPGDPEWHDAEGQRVAFFTNLRPGKYTFRVKACNQNGAWNKEAASLSFSLAPYFWQTWPFYTLCVAGAGLAAFGLHHRRVTVLRRFDSLEREQVLQNERARIARDLHDDLGANLTGIALKADLAQRHVDGPRVSQLADIAAGARALVDNMRGTVWALNPCQDTLENLARFLAQQVENFVTDGGLRCRLELPDTFPEITVPSPARYHIHLVIKEALHNSLKHAWASEIRFSLEVNREILSLRVSDNGIGFDPKNHPLSASNGETAGSRGHGLVNMRQRVENLGAQWEFRSAPGRGTSILIHIPIQSLGAKPK
jgi:signal transduction histidine kinase/ligand-binding sensor domain-containing protein